jgi:hypothetical protein
VQLPVTVSLVSGWLSRLKRERWTFAVRELALRSHQLRPRIYYYPNFLSHDECDIIREKGLPSLKPSKTDAGHHEKVRSSTSYFFSQEQERSTPAIMAAKHRAAAISHTTLEYQEELQMQHYKAPRQGGKQKDFYIPHFDWIPSRPRVATVLIYLEEPEKGGETIFPFVRHNSSARNAQLYTREQAEPLTLNMWNAGACTAEDKDFPWLRVRPQKGGAVLFYNIHPDNTLDALSIHGSCPVLKGQKTVLQQWLSTIWMAPIYTQGMRALWRNPSFAPATIGSVDGSGNGWTLRPPLRESTKDGGGICTGRGVLKECAESRQFSISFLVALEFCSEKSSVRLSLTSSKKHAPTPAVWDVRVKNCQLTLTVPGSASTAAPLTAPVKLNEWTHVTVLTEDMSFDPLGRNTSQPWHFKTHLIVQGQRGAQEVAGEVAHDVAGGGGALNWEASRVCLYNHFADHADFAQVYVLSRQLSAVELKTIRQKSAADRSEPRPGMV